jgi:hypothetical protein
VHKALELAPPPKPEFLRKHGWKLAVVVFFVLLALYWWVSSIKYGDLYKKLDEVNGILNTQTR